VHPCCSSGLFWSGACHGNRGGALHTQSGWSHFPGNGTAGRNWSVLCRPSFLHCCHISAQEERTHQLLRHGSFQYRWLRWPVGCWESLRSERGLSLLPQRRPLWCWSDL
ncbi:hypothetical protein FOZ63_027819, partial [Perkinsus olseni]